jgi:hypothetical protein
MSDAPRSAGRAAARPGAGLCGRALVESAGPPRAAQLDHRGAPATDRTGPPRAGSRTQSRLLLWRAADRCPCHPVAICQRPSRQPCQHRLSGVGMCTTGASAAASAGAHLGQRLLAYEPGRADLDSAALSAGQARRRGSPVALSLADQESLTESHRTALGPQHAGHCGTRAPADHHGSHELRQ